MCGGSAHPGQVRLTLESGESLGIAGDRFVWNLERDCQGVSCRGLFHSNSIVTPPCFSESR